MNNKGYVIELMAFIVIGILAVLFFGGLIYGFGQINTILSSGDLDTPDVNISDLSGKSFAHLNSGMSNLRIIAFVMIIGYMFATFIVAYFSAKHPIWLFLYFLITIMLVIFSVYVSNVYDEIKADPIILEMTSGFSFADVVISKLPIFVSLIGLFGITISIVGIFMVRRFAEG